VKLEDLNKLYDDAETVDKAVFAEQRANVLLVSGDHYSQTSFETKYSGLRGNREAANKQMKLRIVKNHCYKLNRRYVKSVLQNAGGVKFLPQVDFELAHQKAAELNNSVWQYIRSISNLKEKERRWASDFCALGEVFVKVFWDENAGVVTGYNAEKGEEGEDLVDENGELIPNDKSPVFSGKFKFERIFGFNLLRDPDAKEIEESPYLISRKLMPISDLKRRYKGNDEITKKLSDGDTDEYIVFDTNNSGYTRAKGKTTIREYFFRPSKTYPEGYYYITTKDVILEEGELPYGHFPILGKCFDEHQTSPRGRSFLKQAKPYQTEINRSASHQALTQITLGSDKILYQAGTKLEPGALLPGVRGISYSGQQPVVMEGRDGMKEQGYIESQISEMYGVLDANDLFAANGEVKGSNDLYALLYRNAAQRQQLSEYSEKFEEFLMEICKLTIELAKIYLPDEEMIPAIGKHEMINIAEFRDSEPLLSKVKVESQDDTLDTRFGKQMTFQHLMQYGGNNLSKQDIGLLMRSMPYGNAEEQFREYTIDYDNARNIMLALDRGDYPESIPEDNHEYMVTKLSSRMKQADFKMLDKKIQEAYQNKRQEHQQFLEEERQRTLAEQSEYIPSDGALIACDIYVEDKADPGKAPKRARIPQKALDWLMGKLEAQQGLVQSIEGQNLGEMQTSEGIRNAMNQGQPGEGMPPGMPGMESQGMPPQEGGGMGNMGNGLPPLI
jgi:hypothetical protein